MGPGRDYSVFEYLYRDAGNYKTHACVLLRGRALDEDHAAIRRALDDGCFVPEQVGLPSLHAQHWRDCGSEFDDELDHPLHEFSALRPARADYVETLTPNGTVAQLAARFTSGSVTREIDLRRATVVESRLKPLLQGTAVLPSRCVSRRRRW